VLIGMGIGGIGIAASPGGARALFNPASVANMAFWLKSEVGVLDASGNPITVDNTSVYTWQDQSGNGKHFLQPEAFRRPEWRNAANGVNGRPAVQFAASMVSSSPISMSAISIFTVIKLSAGLILYEQGGGVFISPGFRLNVGSANTAMVSKGSPLVINAKNHPTTNWGINNVTKLASHIYNGTNATHILYVNGVNSNMVGQTPYVLDPGTAAVSSAIYLGGQEAAQNPVTGYICEVIGYNAALSDANRTGVESYLMSKWGL